MPPFKERVDLVAMGLDARLEAPVKMSMMKTAGCLVAWRDADMERIDAICSPLASTPGRQTCGGTLRYSHGVIKGEFPHLLEAVSSRFVI